jgi:hypothetical protein
MPQYTKSVLPIFLGTGSFNSLGRGKNNISWHDFWGIVFGFSPIQKWERKGLKLFFEIKKALGSPREGYTLSPFFKSSNFLKIGREFVEKPATALVHFEALLNGFIKVCYVRVLRGSHGKTIADIPIHMLRQRPSTIMIWEQEFVSDGTTNGKRRRIRPNVNNANNGHGKWIGFLDVISDFDAAWAASAVCENLKLALL